MRQAWAILAVLLGLVLLWRTLQVDFVIFAGILFAIFLHRLAMLVARLTGFGWHWALLATVSGLVCLSLGIGYLFASTMFAQLQKLPSQFSGALDQLQKQVGQLSWGDIPVANVNLKDVLNSDTVKQLFGVASDAVYLVGTLVVIAFLGFYLAADQQVYERGLICLLPARHRVRAWQVLTAIGDTLWYWTLGRLISMTVVGIVATLGLWALGVSLPLALGWLAGLLTFVPYLGAVAAAVPAVLIAFAASREVALYVVLLYLGVHVVEGYLLMPLIQTRSVRMPPALTLATQILFGTVAGILGVTFATPVAAALIAAVRLIYVEPMAGRNEGSG
jgi:predicted PurR-regulated permease PerM